MMGSAAIARWAFVCALCALGLSSIALYKVIEFDVDAAEQRLLSGDPMPATAREEVKIDGYGSVEDQFSTAAPASNTVTLAPELPPKSADEPNDGSGNNQITNRGNETVVDIGKNIDADDVYPDYEPSYEVVNIGPDLDADQP